MGGRALQAEGTARTCVQLYGVSCIHIVCHHHLFLELSHLRQLTRVLPKHSPSPWRSHSTLSLGIVLLWNLAEEESVCVLL